MEKSTALEMMERNWKRERRGFIERSFTPRVQKLLKELPDLKDNVNPLECRFIHGKPNTGKTIFAYRLLIHHFKNWFFDFKEEDGLILRNKDSSSYKIVPFLDMFEQIKEAFGTGKRKIHDYKNADVLIIDDFGIEKLTGWEYQTLYSIINHRYEYLKITYITSNMSPKELLDKGIIDLRIQRRIAETYIETEKQPWDAK